MTPEQNSDLLDLTHSSSIEELWDLHCRRMTRFGFDRLLYGFTRFRTATSLGDPNDFIVLSNIGSDYVETFVQIGRRPWCVGRWKTTARQAGPCSSACCRAERS